MAKPTELSRAERKAKKRALEDAIPDLPSDDTGGDIEVGDSKKAEKKSKKRKRNGEADAEVGDMLVEEKEKTSKKSKKEKKEKRSKGEDDDVEVGGEEGVADDKSSKKSKKEKKEKIDKIAKEEPAPEPEVESADVVMADADAEDSVPKKSKKERKAERRAAELAAAKEAESSTPKKTKSKSKAVKADAETNSNGQGGAKSETDGDGDAEKKAKKNNRNREKKRKGEINGDAGASAEDGKEGEEKNHRFIVFVGNLPFTATKDSIRKHFASVQPKSIRPMTEKSNPTKCKGSAFVEFEGYDHMKTCLKLFHHSNFDDGLSAPRKINVELTVGGGGNTKNRKAKIEEKNTKLNEERVRRMQEEEKAKLTKAATGGVDESAIHPSRRRFVPGAQ